MWELRTLKHAYRERPPTEYVIDNFLTKGSLNIFYGGPGSFKSMILADAMAAVVAGTEWIPNALGKGQGFATRKGAGLWVDMDNGTRRMDGIMESVSRARNLPEDAQLYYVSMPTPPLQFHPGYRYPMRDENGEETVLNVIDILRMFIETIRSVNAELVVIDNLGLITGDVEENSAEMASVMAHLRMIAEKTDAAIVVIHHQTKGNGNIGGRPGDRLRGHGSIEAAIDLGLHVGRKEAEATMVATKVRGADVPKVVAEFSYEHKPGTRDLIKAWFSGKAGPRGENAIADAISDCLSHGPMAKTKLIENVNEMLPDTGKRKITAWIEDMIGLGDLIIASGRGGNVKMISLPK
jgi:hypothetical protein